MQTTLFDLITDITNETFCELCLQPCDNNVHKECAYVWWDEIVMKNFKEDEDN